MRSTHFFVLLFSLLFLALGAIVVSQASREAQSVPTVQTTDTVAPAPTTIRV